MAEISRYNTLLMGDSQLQRINPALFPDSTFNFASSGEHYFFTYQKLAHLLSFPDTKIRRVILGVSIHNFAPVYNRMKDLKQPEGKASLARYLYFLNADGISDWLIQDFTLKYTVKGILAAPDWGGFYESNHKYPDTSILRKTFDIHYKIGEDKAQFALEQLEYLQRIQALCAANKVALVLLATPYHPVYHSWIEAAYKSFFDEQRAALPEQLFLNYSNDLNADLMSDANHLNKAGASSYTQKIFGLLYADSIYNSEDEY